MEVTPKRATRVIRSTVAFKRRSGKGPVTQPSGFDDHRPPSKEIIADCVHCGFCLPTCPTYALWAEEMDTPRGRIYLMGMGLEGEALTPTMARHFDSCLGCMACVTACPSGVQYNKLIDATRAQVERHTERSFSDRALREAVFALFPYPRRLKLLRPILRAYQASAIGRILRKNGLLERISPTLSTMESIVPRLGRWEGTAERTVASGARRGTVGMLLGCVQREFFPEVNAATARVLSAEGFDVISPPQQGCCGALSVHNGREEQARSFAKQVIDCFDAAGVDQVVVNSAGCGSSMKEYGELLSDDPAYARLANDFAEKVLDITEFLAKVGTVAQRHPLQVTVAYHDACHLAHSQGVRDQPRALLLEIPGLELKEIADSAICCGSAGVWNVFNPEPSRQLGDKKAANIVATGASLLVAGNPGCLMQEAAALERMGETGTRISLAHTVQVIDASIRGLALADITPAHGGNRATVHGLGSSSSVS